MPVRLTDAQIHALVHEGKVLPAEFHRLIRTRMREKRGHREFDYRVTGEAGSRFKLIIRQSIYNPLDFTVGLLYLPDDSSHEFILCRYNGKHGEHGNPIEGDRFYDFHIHTATERYQLRGDHEDTYADVTDRYGDLSSAIDCMIRDCGFRFENGENNDLGQWGF